MQALGWSLIALASFVVMEGLAWLSHRYVMHGWGWGWHRSHHEPRQGWFERNDLYALVGLALSVGLFLIAGRLQWPALQAAAVGVTAYGLVYAFVHDGLVHQRWPFRYLPRNRYLRRLVQAHRLHHAMHTREGAVSFGFLVAPDPRRLAETLKARRARQRGEMEAGHVGPRD
ncbi:sterol desaturase family protein [Ramlibacter tataouinensis]|uniref:Candidate beta-carotene hydroxylase n=1 Tax=Ramlibacter tataouinensis (strain ATCC BAA-407 / DSM 14655 / LMG 21543 / TTB310) TaxID=365046 RepID=F5XXP6_RAMTT|nr:sterol desaturase family protein [Ramlibacter tataouinensis]AEG91849.1 Candidate beta-carotene hydroxylase [Ramlibacter tataouinensis TTB310]